MWDTLVASLSTDVSCVNLSILRVLLENRLLVQHNKADECLKDIKQTGQVMHCVFWEFRTCTATRTEQEGVIFNRPEEVLAERGICGDEIIVIRGKITKTIGVMFIGTGKHQPMT